MSQREDGRGSRPNRSMSGQRLSMIGKSATTRKVSINEAKQEFLIQAGINRYGEPQSIADFTALPGLSDKFASMATR